MNHYRSSALRTQHMHGTATLNTAADPHDSPPSEGQDAPGGATSIQLHLVTIGYRKPGPS